jgi:lysozyme
VEYDRVAKLIIGHEGFSGKAYYCPAGLLTIGYGRNIEGKGITENEARYLLKNDIDECFSDLQNIFPEFSSLTENRQAALIDMRFNLGGSGFRKFKKTIEAVQEYRFSDAEKEMKASLWFHQVKDRAKKLCAMMRAG